MGDAKRLWSVAEVVLVTAAYIALTRLSVSAFDLSGALPGFLSRDEAAVGGVFLVGALAQFGFVLAAVALAIPEFRTAVASSFRPAPRQAWIVALIAAAIQCATIILFFLPEPARVIEPSPRNFLLSMLPVADGWTQEIVFRGYLMLRLGQAGWPVWAQIAASGVAFASIHLGYIGSANLGVFWPAAGTATLGAFLAWSVVLAKRSLLPAIAAHVLIIIVIQPWLALAR